MKSSNLCPKQEGGSGMDTPFKPLCHSCFTAPLTTGSSFAHGVMQWVIILLSVNLIPLLPTGVLGSSAANKEHISREDKIGEKARQQGYKGQSKQSFMLDTKHNLPLAPNAETLLHNILAECS